MRDSKKIKSIKEEIESLLKYNAYSVVNMMLNRARLKVSEMSDEKMIAYAKYSEPAKDIIPAWKAYVSAAKIELKNRKLDESLLEF